MSLFDVERKFIKPYKAITICNETHDVSELYKGLSAGKHYVEPKIDGMAVWLVKEGQKVGIFSSEKKELSEKLPLITKAILGLPGDFILIGELVVVKRSTDDLGLWSEKLLGHEEIVARANRLAITETNDVRFIAFDMIFQGEAGDLRNKSLVERRGNWLEFLIDQEFSEVGENMPVSNIGWSLFDTREHSEEDLRRITARRTTEEGVVIKGWNSKYDHEGSKSWWKLKWYTELDLIVLDKRLVLNSTCTYNYGLGFLSSKGEIVRCGKSMNTNIQAEEGDILKLKVERVNRFSEGKYGVYLARVVSKREDKQEPDPESLLEIRSGSKLCTIR